ncbi:hypothetical protein BDD12DRAFT_859026, partial [Trichophaea hybrida]
WGTRDNLRGDNRRGGTTSNNLRSNDDLWGTEDNLRGDDLRGAAGNGRSTNGTSNLELAVCNFIDNARSGSRNRCRCICNLWGTGDNLRGDAVGDDLGRAASNNPRSNNDFWGTGDSLRGDDLRGDNFRRDNLRRGATSNNLRSSGDLWGTGDNLRGDDLSRAAGDGRSTNGTSNLELAVCNL